MKTPMKSVAKLCAAGLVLQFAAASFAQDAGYEPPMLDFGVPDLQGIWTYETRAL